MYERGAVSRIVNFVLSKGMAALSAIEVKGGHESSQSGMAAFLKEHPQTKRLAVGGAASGACDLESVLKDEVDLFYWG